MKFISPITFISLSLSLLTPSFASAQVARMGIEQLPPTFVVEETSQELTARGCQAQAFTSETKSFLVNPEMPYPVIPSTIAAAVTDGRGTIFFCSKQIVESLTVQGKVSFLGIGKIAKAAAKGAAPVVGVVGAGGNIISGTVGTILTIVMTLVANVLTILMSLAAMGATYFLDYGGYLSNPIVQTGWPFVLGFANLGFVLALLFIALATVLRLESFSARRLLPRLLIAALMINFSLMIAVFIIDASRLVMTVIAQGLASDSRCTGTAIACLPANVLAKSQLVQTVFSVHGDSLLAVSPAILDGNSRFSSVPFPGYLDTIQAMFMIALMTLAFLVLMILLLIRWLALVVLLVLSPLAYLFVALPGTGKWARMWWDHFIKYVLYGPVIVLVLSLFVRAQDPLYKALQENFKSLNTGEPGITRIALGDTTAGIFMTALSAAFLFGAAMAGEKLGVIGGQMATTRFKQGAGLIGKTAYVGSGAQFAARRTGEAATDVGRWVSRPVREFMARQEGKRQQRLGYKTAADKRAIDEATRKGQQQARDYQRRSLLKPWQRVGPTAEEKYASPLGQERLAKSREWQKETKELQELPDQTNINTITSRKGVYSLPALANPGAVGSLSGNQMSLLAQHSDDDQKKMVSDTLKNMPADLAEAFATEGDGEKVQAVIDHGDMKMLSGMLSNNNITSNMSEDQLTKSLAKLNDPANKPAEPVFDNYINQLGNNATAKDIERVRGEYERDRGQYDRDMADWKEAQSGLLAGMRAAGGEPKKTT